MTVLLKTPYGDFKKKSQREVLEMGVIDCHPIKKREEKC